LAILSLRLLLVALSLAWAHAGERTRRSDGAPGPEIGERAGLPLPKGELRSMLQRFVDHAYLKGFRHLGDGKDFDHGHALYDAASAAENLVAILYHTQEAAYAHHRKDPGGRYDYLDPDARNWIQWMDPGRPIENASRYRYAEKPADWEDETMGSWSGAVEHRTIHHTMLDPRRFGYLVESPFPFAQFFFTRVDCDLLPAERPADGNDVEIALPTGERVCLLLS